MPYPKVMLPVSIAGQCATKAQVSEIGQFYNRISCVALHCKVLVIAQLALLKVLLLVAYLQCTSAMFIERILIPELYVFFLLALKILFKSTISLTH